MMWYQNICNALFSFVTKKHACDRQTDVEYDDSQDCASIDARAVKMRTRVWSAGQYSKNSRI